MKTIGFILLLLSSTLHGASHYISSSGNDLHPGTSPETAWRSIDKVNKVFPWLSPGDSILFRRGDTFSGTIVASKSGRPGKNIVISAYGEGKMPLIQSIEKLDQWEQVSKGIYKAAASCGVAIQMVILEEIPRAKGRYPNNKYLSYESHNGYYSITDSELRDGVNWKGAEIAIRKNRWVIDIGTISESRGNTIIYNINSRYEPTDGFGYFIQNDLRTLDKRGEWYMAKDSLFFCFGEEEPGAHVVEVSTRENLLEIHKCNYITVRDLCFRGANKHTISIHSSDHIVISNCQLSCSGEDAVRIYNSANTMLDSLFINYSLNNAIAFKTGGKGCPGGTVTNCRIRNTGIYPGMGTGQSGNYQAIGFYSDRGLIAHNHIDTVGRNGIFFRGNGTIVRNNYINHFCFVKDDGGGIYTDHASASALIRSNIITNGIGAPEGTVGGTFLKKEIHGAHGIYIDEPPYYHKGLITVDSNAVAHCKGNGIFLHKQNDVYIQDNLIYDCTCQLLMASGPEYPHPTRNVDLNNNIFCVATRDQLALMIYNDSLADLNGDSNYYISPFGNSNIIHVYLTKEKTASGHEYPWPGIKYTLDEWQRHTGRDHNSKPSPRSYIPYTYKIAGKNKFKNGQFNSGITGVSSYNPDRSDKISWVSGKLDGGSLKISYESQAESLTTITFPTGEIQAGQYYLAKYDIVGVKDSKTSLFLRVSSSPFTVISNMETIPVSHIRSTHEALLLSTSSSKNSVLAMEAMVSAGTIWMDKLEISAVDVNDSRPEDYIRFEYNNSPSAKWVDLSSPFIESNGTKHPRRVHIAPYGAKLLFLDTSQ